MRILVYGGRDYLKYHKVEEILDNYYWDVHKSEDPEFIVIQGGAKGADFLAKCWVHTEFSIDPDSHHLEFPAEWKKYGNGAGPKRNQQMIDEGRPTHAIAFPGGNGTADMTKRVKAAGIPLLEVTDAQ